MELVAASHSSVQLLAKPVTDTVRRLITINIILSVNITHNAI